MKASPLRAFLGSLIATLTISQANPPVAGAKVWLRADQGVVTDTSGNVESWEDQSGNMFHFEQGNAAKRPTPVPQGIRLGEDDLFYLATTSGGSTWGVSLGTDFIVDQPVTVTHLAAFDHQRNGISGSIQVQLWQRNDGGTPATPGDDTGSVILEQLTFDSTDSGTLEGSYRWKALPSSRVLAPGAYTLVAWGYTGNDQYHFNSSLPKPPLNPAVRWANHSRYGNSTAGPEWPVNSYNANSANFAGAMNLRFRTTSTPVYRPTIQFDGTDDGLQAVSSLNQGRPCTIFTVFRREGTDSGYILQNSSGGNWWIRNDGFYSNGWVHNADFTSGRLLTTTTTASSADTRAWINHSETTTEDAPETATPGRLALGGGSGQQNDPIYVQIAELLVYDRVLTEGEILATQNYLGERYGHDISVTGTPSISPLGSPGSGDVTVTITSPTPGAQVYYTTDGSQPTTSSTLYTGPFEVSRPTEVRARAFASGLADSGVSTQVYLADASSGSQPVDENIPEDGLQLWLRSDRGVETDTSGNVTLWRDASGNGNDLAQTLSEKRPRLDQAITAGGGTAIRTLYGNSGASNHTGTLGADFVTTSPIVIDRLAAFDHAGDGFSSSVTVQIWSRNDSGTPATPEDDTAGSLLAEAEFTPGAPGTLEGPYRFKPITPINLPAGSYSILAWGFTGSNYYRNSSDASGPPDGVRFVNRSRYIGSNGAWPTTIDSHPVKYNGAGNFSFSIPSIPATVHPVVSFDGSNDGLIAAATSNLSRPNSIFIVFQRDSNGIIAQSSNSWWFLRNDGAYSNGWIRNETIPYHQFQIAGYSLTSTESRFFLNGNDRTSNAGLTTGAPGRLTLGGGSGYSNDPAVCQIAEVIAFNRELSAGERFQVETYLSQRYRRSPIVLPEVAISPGSNYGSGNVNVTLSNPAADADIYYTTDGSEPTTASTLYTGPFSVSRNTEVRARAFSATTGSPVASAYYGTAGGATDLPVSGATTWLRGDAGLDLDENQRVLRWRDLSGNGHHFTQANPDLRPGTDVSLSAQSHVNAIRVPNSDGNTTYSGSLGEDFIVDSPIEITHLGAFDHAADGFAGTITVQLWSRNDGGTPLTPTDDSPGSFITQLTFNSASPGELDGNLRFKPLPETLSLAPGSYTIFAYGYTGTDRYYEGDIGSRGGDSRFRFVGLSRHHSTPGSWPNSLDNRGLDYNGAANFRVIPENTFPERRSVVFDGSNDGLLADLSLNVGRPSTVLIAFQRTRNESGYVLQNSGGGNWWIRNDGFYVNGWVRNEDLAVNQPILAAVTHDSTSTRVFRNGFDVTIEPNLAGVSPGRLALGGGSGQQNDPIPVRVSELIVFDRVLSPGELFTIQSYLAGRHGIYTPELATPTISPPSGFGTDDVTVTLATVTAGAEIRYTTNGSDPDELSTLYEGPFTVSRDTTVKARTFSPSSSLGASGIASAHYGNSGATPLPVTDAALWLRASTGVDTRSDGSVTRWQDLSGNGRDFYPTALERAPKWLPLGYGGPLKTAVVTSSGAVGDTNYNGFVGTDFIVESPVEITHLGAFDSYGDGFSGDITVRLHAVNDGGTPADPANDSSAGILATLTFTPAQPGELRGGNRYLELPSPLLLNPGRYLVESTGWNNGNRYIGSDSYDETLGQGISYPAVSRYNTTAATLFPGNRIADNRYLAASGFLFRKPGASGSPTPSVRFDGIDDGLLGPSSFSLGRPSTVFMVFNQRNGNDGRLLQSGNGQNWLLGPHVNTDGFYANGWITQHTIRRNEPSLVVGVQEPSFSRYYYNGQDLTQAPNYSGNIGRLALGGGEGTYFQPVEADLVELVVYPRVLTESERQLVSAALSSRHDLPREAISPPVASPDGGYYPTGRTVQLSHPIPDTTIRYTTDGSPPDELSTVYTGPFVVSASQTVRSRAFHASFNPSNIEESVFIIDEAAPPVPQRANLQVWLRAGIGTETQSDAVSVWRDLSGSGADAYQNTANARPVLQADAVGGAPGLVFDGSNDHLSLPPGFKDYTQGLTAMFVVRPDAVGSWQRFLELARGPENSNMFFSRYSTTTDFSYDTRGNGSGNLRATNSLLPLSNAIFTVSQTPDGAIRIFHNGSLVAENAIFPLPANILRDSNFIARSNWGSDAYYSGAISEILVYNKALTDLERETLEATVRQRYGIASSATGIVTYSPDSSSLYPSGVTVSLSSTTEDAQIYYTLDGSTPSESSTLYTGPINLTQSTRIRARAFAEGFNASPFSEATYYIGLPPSSGDGLLGTYYDDQDLTGPSLTRVDPTVDFSWGGGSPDPAIGPDQFSVRWTGKVIPRFTEAYTFYGASDDGQRLWIDLNRDGVFDDVTERVINDWVTHGETEVASTPVPLTAGLLYDIRYEMFETTGSAAAKLRWSSFSEPKAIIPQSQLFSNAAFSQTVATPVISPAAATYTTAIEATITTATPGATIYYTTNGAIPDTTSQVYGGPIVIDADTTVRARAYKAGFNPSGVATVFYDIDAQPPVIGDFEWNDAPLSNGETLVAKGTLSVEATDNQGLTRAEFYYIPSGSTNRVLIGSDTSPANGMSFLWDIASIADGTYTLVARVYDTSGIYSEVSRTIQVVLAVPAAPQITLPASGVTVQDPVVGLRVESAPGANIRIFRDGTFIFSGYSNSNGRLEYAAALPTGTSVFKAVAVNRAGPSSDSNLVSVSRVREFPQLVLSFSSNTLAEGSPVDGIVSIPAAIATPLTVQINTNKGSQVESVNPVVIPAGATQAPFTLTARQDTIIELLTTIEVTASATEYRSAVSELFLADDDYPTLTLELESQSVSESHGALLATVRRAVATDRALRVELTQTDPSEASIPAYVDIPAGQTSATFTITILDDSDDDGNQITNIRAQVSVSGQVVAASAIVPLEVRDDEGPVLTFDLVRPYLAEGGSVFATVRRDGGGTSGALNVQLTQAPGTSLTLPPSVTIPSGQPSVTFSITAPSEPGDQGNRIINLRASAPGFTDGLNTLTLTDTGRAELVVSSITSPASILSEQYATVSYRIDNLGFQPALGPYLERVFLSRDATFSSDDLLVRQTDFTGELAAGGGYDRNVTILTPRDIGNYYVIVTVDPGNSVAEINETNNTRVHLTPMQVRAAYSAVVQTAAEVVPANTPITFTGSATRDGGQPAAFSMINIHIGLNGTTRVISAVTNSLGQFSVNWTPLRNEGGSYTIGAAHPGTASAPVQDEFEILTLGVDSPPFIVMSEGDTVATQLVLRNPNTRALNGVSVSITGLPSGLAATPTPPAATIAAGGELVVPISVIADTGFSGSGSFPINVTTGEGISMQGVLSVRVERLRPVLTIEPGNLSQSVLRGTSKTLSLTIRNTGGLASGPIQVLLPDLPWLSFASANPIPSIPPGASSTVSLLLNPGITVPLNQYSGNIALNPSQGDGRSVPYQFRVVSDLLGDLEIDVVDERFFYTAEAPHLEGARVTVRDAITAAQIATLTTGADGLARFTSLPEGWYRIEVVADEHDTFSGNYYINAGQNNSHQIFISKQLVKYTWTVEEIEIEDTYRVQVETTFETNVPAPVVTATPNNFDVSDLVALGQTKTINVTLENHGFIAAQHSEFTFSDHPFYEFKPLVTNIGTIPAKSSLVVPVTITRIGVFGDNGEVVTLRNGNKGQITKKGVGLKNGNVPCGAGGKLNYDYPCGEWLIEKAVVMAVNGVQGSCSGSGGPGGGYIGFIGGFYGGYGYGGPGGGGTTASNGAITFTAPDPCLTVCILRSIADCAIGFTPVGCFYSAAQCFDDPGFTDTCLWALAGCGADLAGIGPWVNGANCIYSFAKCFYSGGGGGAGGPGGSGPPITGSNGLRNFARDDEDGFILDEDFNNFAPDVAAAWERVLPVLEMYELHYGSKALVLAHGDPEGLVVMQTFGNACKPGSPGDETINPAEAAEILTQASGAELEAAVVQRAIDRWNRTLAYRAQNIFEIEDVPSGDSTDFIPRSAQREIAQRIIAAYDASRAAGFIEPMHEFLTRSQELRETLLGDQGGTCARVKIQLSQDVMMTRTAFRATLQLENERSDGPITEVGFDLQIRDSAGLPAEDLFNIQITKLTGLEAIDGTGEIPASGNGSAQWTLIPRDTAALDSNRTYTVGGVIRYVQGGTTFNIPVENVPITVRPDASLDLKYFHQRDVYSDDPHTDQIEPSEPYRLSVLVTNNGYGEARNLRIVSGQPKIVDNEKGLFIDFKIIGTEVDGQPLSPSLTADFGNLAPGQSKIATWLMTSTLQGLFTDYSATFEHVSGLGDPRISLLKNVEIHEMIRAVLAQGPGQDSSPDFLVNDVPDANDYPDTIHYSHGGTDLVTLRQTGTFSGAPSVSEPVITLNTGNFTGWSYIRLPDPSLGQMRLISVTRSDGRVLPIDQNAWQTDRTFIGGGRRPRYEAILHLADSDSTGSYTLQFAPLAPPDVTPPTSSVAALPATSLADIPVTWSGSDDREVSVYDIFVSVNGGPFEIWRDNTTDHGAIYPGTPGTTYSFYSLAVDSSGNIEAKSPAAEATTTVANTNQPPVIVEIPDQTIDEGTTFQLRAFASDPDGPSSAIRFSLGSSYPGMRIDPSTGVITWNTGETDGGRVVTVIVVATDTGFPAAVANEQFTITVLDVNSAPTLRPVPPQTLEQGGVLIVHAEATDGDFPVQTVSFSLTDAPSGASIHPTTGVIQWSPTAQQAGSSYPFTIRATDNGTPQNFAETSFSVSVVAPTDSPPSFTQVPVVLWLKGQTYSLTVAATDVDGDPIALSANLATTPGATFQDLGSGAGSLGWNTTSATIGTYVVPVTATANGVSTTASVRIRIADNDLYWNWIRDTFGELPDGFDLSLLSHESDPDGDGRGNVHEMALLTNPLRHDQPKVAVFSELLDPFAMIQLGLHRRVGSAKYVTFSLERTTDLSGPWSLIDPADISLDVNPNGDDDGNPQSEYLNYNIFEYHELGLPRSSFYRLRTTIRPGLSN